MADMTGNDPKPGSGKLDTSKPETKSGPVKPPVLDLKAREAGSAATARPEPGTTASKPAHNPTEKPKIGEKPAEKPAAPTNGGSSFPLMATVAGVLGLAAAYGLAWAGLWPAAPVPAATPDPRLASFARAIPELETVTQTTQSELAALNQRIGALETDEPAATTAGAVDLAPIENEVAALSAKLDSLSSGPTDTAGADALRTEVAAMGSKLDELAARLGTAEADLRGLDTTVTETSATLAGQPTDIGAILQLPLILSGLETAFASGRSYTTELGALRAALPDAAIPTGIANASTTGLTRPDTIARRFAEVLPAMLAGKPANPNAQWQDGALDWFASAIALRPTGEIEGDTPDAVMSRLEGAVARRDFTAAEVLLADLPQPMLTAGGDVPTMIASQAEAARFLDDLRASALSGEAMQ